MSRIDTIFSAPCAVGRRLAELDQARIDAALQQELRVLVDRCRGPCRRRCGARPGSAGRAGSARARSTGAARAPAGAGAPSTARRWLRVGLNVCDRHAQRHAGAAAVAVGPVGEHAAAPEAVGDQPRIGVGVDQVARRGDLRARHAARRGSCTGTAPSHRTAATRAEALSGGSRVRGVPRAQAADPAPRCAPHRQIIGPIADPAGRRRAATQAALEFRARDLARRRARPGGRCAAGSRSSARRVRGRSTPARRARSSRHRCGARTSIRRRTCGRG